MEPSKSPYTRDSKSPDAASEDGQVKTEVVNDIPVQTQAGAPNPIAAQPVTADNQDGDKDLDRVLSDVNREVGKQSVESQDKKKLPLPAKKIDAKTKTPKKPGTPKPVLAITVAVIMGMVLMIAAYMAFKGSK